MQQSTPPIPLTLTDAERARAQQVDLLVALGADGVPELVDLLTDPSWVVRRAVIAGLASLGDAAVGPLCEALILRRDDEARIAAAVDALVASVGRVEEQVSETLARHANEAVVADAAQILGRRRDPGSVPCLRELLSHRDDNVAVAATEALGRIGGRAAVDSLVEAVASQNFFRVFPAIDVLGRSGDARAVLALSQLLPNPMYATEAARALGRTAEKAAVAPLAKLLSSPAEAMVRVAAVSLMDLHKRHGEKYGDATAIEQAIHAACSEESIARRLAQALSGADPDEQSALSHMLGMVGGLSAVAPLTQLLEGPQSVAQAAALALRRLGQESDARALQTLRKGDSQSRRALLPVVYRSAATEAVVACLSDPDPMVRTLACDALSRIGNPAAVEPLFSLLKDKHPGVAQAAVAAIQSLGGDRTQKLAAEAVGSPSPTVRRAGLRILSYFGGANAVPLFLAALKDGDDRVRDAAIGGLPFLEDRAGLDALFDVTRSDAPRARAAAMRALGFAVGDMRIEATLLRGMEDADEWVRYYACQALGRLGVQHSVEKLAERLADDAGQVRVAAVEALSHLGTPRAAELLVAAARSREEDVRRAALIGLGLGKTPGALEVLLEAAGANDAATRLVAISALADLSEPGITAVLARAAADPEETVRASAIGFLASRPGQEATNVLISLLPDPDRRQAAREALAIRAQGRVDALLTALEHADDELAPELTAALARMRRGEATAALFRALEIGNAPARKAAASTLAALGSRQAMDALQVHAAGDPDPEVRRVCALLLAQ